MQLGNICTGPNTGIVLGKDTSKNIKWTYFENWKHVKHTTLGETLVGALIIK